MQQEVGRTNGPVMFRPTISVRDAAVPADRLTALLAEAARFRVPVTWFDATESVTSDVGARGFEFYSQDQPPAVVTLEWSHDKPAGWEPVLEWCGRLRRFLEGCLAETTWQI